MAKIVSLQRRALQVGPVLTTNRQDFQARMAILLWGPAGVGKTTFAATAPGSKLWLSFGDQEHVSVMHRDDIDVAHLAEIDHAELFKHAQSENPFGLDRLLAENPHIQTVVVDSSTAIAFKALQRAVAKGIGRGNHFVPTMEAPGIAAYGGRNAIVLETMTGLLKVTAKHNVHLIITAHEDDPVREESTGTVLYITTQLGGKLVNNMTWRLSEIWYVSETQGAVRTRRLAIRPTRLRRPMKTRMFTDKGEPEFNLIYDSTLPDEAAGQMTITGWYDQWMEGKGSKLLIPTTAGSVSGRSK
jgi:hypothetical protein